MGQLETVTGGKEHPLKLSMRHQLKTPQKKKKNYKNVQKKRYMKCVSKRHNSRDLQMIALKSFTLLGEVMRNLKTTKGKKKKNNFGLILKTQASFMGL